ncbi:MAG: class II aldolase/adducin family protein [Clostridiales bacterium]|nr:class II aldolase/adducin family protein [Candidatus Apopatocola equi]
MSRKDELKKEICEKSLQAFHAGLFAGTSGNMSVYLRDEGIMLITPTSVRYETMRPEDIVEMKPDGTLLKNDNPSSEWRLHAEIYRANEDVSAVFHTHSPHATAFAVNRMDIPATLIEAYFFLGGSVPCAEYATPGTPEVGIYAAKVLPGKGGCLLANHGVVAVGSDLSQAYIRAEYIEDAAKICIMARQIGTPVELEHL